MPTGGVTQTQARNAAQEISERYRKGNYSGKLSNLISDRIKKEIKLAKRFKV